MFAFFPQSILEPSLQEVSNAHTHGYPHDIKENIINIIRPDHFLHSAVFTCPLYVALKVKCSVKFHFRSLSNTVRYGMVQQLFFGIGPARLAVAPYMHQCAFSTQDLVTGTVVLSLEHFWQVLNPAYWEHPTGPVILKML